MACFSKSNFVVRVMCIVHDIFSVKWPNSLEKLSTENKHGIFVVHDLSIARAVAYICKYRFHNLELLKKKSLEITYLQSLFDTFSEIVFLEFLCLETILCFDTEDIIKREKLITIKYNLAMKVLTFAKNKKQIDAGTWAEFDFAMHELELKGCEKYIVELKKAKKEEALCKMEVTETEEDIPDGCIFSPEAVTESRFYSSLSTIGDLLKNIKLSCTSERALKKVVQESKCLDEISSDLKDIREKFKEKQRTENLNLKSDNTGVLNGNYINYLYADFSRIKTTFDLTKENNSDTGLKCSFARLF